MRTRRTFGVAIFLGCFILADVAHPALAAPKKKKAEPAAETPAPEPAKEKNVDDLMQESGTTKSASSGAAAGGGEKPKAEEEPVGEPDAWERPPADEEKPKPVAAAKA